MLNFLKICIFSQRFEYFCIYYVRSRKYGLLLFINSKNFKHEKSNCICSSSKHDML